jgi:hypothetical protein
MLDVYGVWALGPLHRNHWMLIAQDLEWSIVAWRKGVGSVLFPQPYMGMLIGHATGCVRLNRLHEILLAELDV